MVVTLGQQYNVVAIMLLLELSRCSSDLFVSSRPRTGLATTKYMRVDYIITGYS